MEPVQPLLGVTALAIGAWAAALAYAALGVRPNDPADLPATTELGEETPAVAGLLSGGFKVSTEAVPATLIDLAARRVLHIELVAAGNHVIRLREGVSTESLTEYERQVLEHVQSIAVHGIVPAQALSTGPKAASLLWWFHFREAVIHDAQSRGLSVNRWTGKIAARLWLAALAPAFAFAAAVRFDFDLIFGSWWSFAEFAALLGMAATLLAITFSRSQRDTPRGLDAAARWLAVRKGLAANESLATLPPSAVAIWERHFAHAAAMGLAPAAVEGLPLGAEDDKLAWSSQGGVWRRVRILYPRVRPGWGSHPGAAVAFALVWGVPASLLLTALLPLRRPRPDVPLGNLFWLAGVVLAGICAVAALWSVVALARAIPDLLAGDHSVVGTVLRKRSRKALKLNPLHKGDKWKYFLAVDDGSSPAVAAFSVKEQDYLFISQGNVVRATVTPRLGYVSAIVPAALPQAGDPPAPKPLLS